MEKMNPKAPDDEEPKKAEAGSRGRRAAQARSWEGLTARYGAGKMTPGASFHPGSSARLTARISSIPASP